MTIKIGFLGPKGTFSQEACETYIKGKNEYTVKDIGSIADLILAVYNGEIDEAIVPIENSIEGAINTTMDMLAFDVNLKIKDEVIININQNILIKKGTRVENIKYVISHPQPIGQCRKYLNNNFPNAQINIVYSTSEASKIVAEGDGNCAAIGSSVSASVYDLEVLAREIQDDGNNRTRFVVIGKCEGNRTGRDKTSIVFSTDNKPGSLYRVLDIFNLWDINMTRIESRPAKNQLGRYIFFVDIIGHMEDEDIKDAITMIKKKTSFFKLLGSYPQAPNF